MRIFAKLYTSNALKCTNCGMTYDEFVDKGKFGCENCYNVFENRIDPVLKIYMDAINM